MENLEKEDTEYTFPLDAASREKAEKELRETDAERLGSVRALREWALQRKDWLHTPLDIKFLLRFLRVRKFTQLTARQTLENYWKARTDTPEWFRDIDSCDPDIQEIIGTGMCLVVPGTDKEGRLLCFDRPGALDVDWAMKKFGVNKIFKALICLFDWVLMNVNAQVNGIMFVEDLTGFSIRHSMKLYTTEVSKKFTVIYQDAYPCRTKDMLIYNEPPIFDPLFAVIKPLMKKKLRDRVHMIGKNLTSVYKRVDMDMLPTEYLPDDYTGSKVGSVKDCIAYMQNELKRPEVREEIMALSSDKYGIDLAKKPKDSEPQASFRKLNVS